MNKVEIQLILIHSHIKSIQKDLQKNSRGILGKIHYG